MAGKATVRAPSSRATSSARRWADASSSSSPCVPPRQTGPTAWMTHRDGSRPPVVAFASPVAHPPRRLHSSRIAGPPARWIAPSTPPPPSSDSFAAFTIASTRCSVRSPTTNESRSGIRPVSLASEDGVQRVARPEHDLGHDDPPTPAAVERERRLVVNLGGQHGHVRVGGLDDRVVKPTAQPPAPRRGPHHELDELEVAGSQPTFLAAPRSSPRPRGRATTDRGRRGSRTR